MRTPESLGIQSRNGGIGIVSLHFLLSLSFLLGLCGSDAVEAGTKDPSGFLEVKTKAVPKSTHCDITVTALNRGSKPLMLKFNTAQQYEFYAKDENQRIVWKWSNDRVFAEALTNITLAPGETFSRSAKWNYLRNDGHRVPAGKYQIMGAITPQPQHIFSGPVPIEVLKASAAG